jgi:hypothetical protein
MRYWQIGVSLDLVFVAGVAVVDAELVDGDEVLKPVEDVCIATMMTRMMITASNRATMTTGILGDLGGGRFTQRPDGLGVIRVVLCGRNRSRGEQPRPCTRPCTTGACEEA